MRLLVAMAIASMLVPSSPARKARSTQPARASRSFEELAQGAVELVDVEKAVGPFLQSCGNTKSLADIQCRAIRSFMQRRASRRTYLTSTRDALRFGAYDASRFVVPVKVLGCISCSKPLRFDPVLYSPNLVFVTTRTPKAVKDGTLQGVELASFEIRVDPRKTAEWERNVKPYLMVQFLYRVTPDGVWPKELGRGFTLHMGGFRVYNRCTGEVLYSQPPSQGTVPVDRKGCPGTAKKVAKKKKVRLLPRLSSSKFLAVMKKARGAFSKCYEMYQIPGKSKLVLKIRGRDGKVVSVRIKGQFRNTPTGECLLKAAQGLTFPPFARPFQEFTYLVILP